MNAFNKKILPALIAPLFVMMAAQTSYAADDGVNPRGKMIDNSRSFETAPTGNTEFMQPAMGGDLKTPSNVMRLEKQIMLDSIKTLPRQGPSRVETLSDAALGALFASGLDDLLPASKQGLDKIASDLHGKSSLRFLVIGHADTQRMTAATKKRFRDNQGLSEARAFQVAQYLKAKLGLQAEAFSVRGESDTRPVASNATPAGMAQNRRVEVQIWYENVVEQALPPRRIETLAEMPLCPELQANVQGTGLANLALPFRMTVDGMPMNAIEKISEADRQRCVDVALNRADIEMKYDPLKALPALNVSVWPNGVVLGKPVIFDTYANYIHWIRKAEIRLFAKGQNPQEPPLLVLPVKAGEALSWTPGTNVPSEVFFLLRVYDEQGRFDETTLKSLTILDHARGIKDESTAARERLTGYGENSLRVHNIPVSGGTITVSGKNVKPGQSVFAMGYAVPVDANGSFALRQMLPPGAHSVEVEMKQADGTGTKFSRNLSIADDDWFYIAMADLTASKNHTVGPAQLVTQDNDRYAHDTEISGRTAFYLKGKIKGEYLLTMSADTQERPLGDLFSNFASKDPRYLLNRIDPDRYYPVYGDDSRSEWDAPTNGRFYVRLERGDSYAMWGNFQTQWTGLEFNQFSRALYGANLALNSTEATGFGERKQTLNVFAAEPGTLGTREEFRATGGSLYYLRRQDITRGSEHIWVEVRDKDSGIAIDRIQLVPAQDYDLSYLQGRILLRAPLSSTADGSALVQTASLSGNPVYLVATYEYAPGLSEANSNVYGLRGSAWVNDYLRLGVNGYRQGDDLDRQRVGGLDATLRYAPGTYLNLEAARSKGAADQFSSLDGGFGFNQSTAGSSNDGADGKRLQGIVDFSEIVEGTRGRATAYWQNRESGFSAPGQLTPAEALTQHGASFSVPFGVSTSFDFKADERKSTSQSLNAVEAAVREQLDEQWSISLATRRDDLNNTIANASPLLSQNGARTDVVLRVDFKPLIEATTPSPQPSPPCRARSPEYGPAVTSACDMSHETPTPPDAGEGAKNTGSLVEPLLPHQREKVGMRADGAEMPDSSNTTSTIKSATSNPIPVSTSTLQPQTISHDSTKSLVPSDNAALVDARPAPWQAYGFIQGTAERSEDRSANNRGGLGALWQLNDRFKLGVEGSGGNGGAGGKVSGDYRVDDRSNVYLTYTMETDRPDETYRGRLGTAIAGSRYKLSDQVGIYGETRSAHGAGPESLTNAFGLDYAPNDRWTYGVKMEFGTISDPLAGDLKRQAIGLSSTYRIDQIKFTDSIEYRDENGTAGARKTWLTRNTAGYQATPDWRLIGKLDASYSQASQGNFYDGNFVDASLGAAWRPVKNDRWNSLFEYRYYYTLPSPGQVGLNDQSLDYAQRSHILSVDTIYDLKPWVSIGAKYGLRIGELRNSREEGEWFSSRADLVVVRADFHWIKQWDMVIEARRLAAHEADNSRSGFLAAAYRHFNAHIKVGVGYNFTDFSDDLTDQSYRSRGPFINILSTF